VKRPLSSRARRGSPRGTASYLLQSQWGGGGERILRLKKRLPLIEEGKPEIASISPGEGEEGAGIFSEGGSII